MSTFQGVTYATLPLCQEDYQAYYTGFANQTIWPLFHYRTGLAATRRSFAEGYYRVNGLFAQALLPHLKPDDLIWVHDYHLIPLGHELRKAGCKQRLGFFLHIPWPVTEVLSALPGHRDLVKRLFSYDVVGFQTPGYVRAFIDYILLEEKGEVLGPDRVLCFGREITVKAFPIGCDAQTFADVAGASRRPSNVERIRESIAGRSMIIGVDRLDYSKGLDRRLRSFALLLERWPEFHRQVFMLQIAPVSRSQMLRNTGASAANWLLSAARSTASMPTSTGCPFDTSIKRIAPRPWPVSIARAGSPWSRLFATV
jgi:trehalose 6-phosphate synthase